MQKPITLYPAIDLKDGHCVRLYKGDMDQATIYGDNPAAQAKKFADAGCSWLHIVDLDGAFDGKPANSKAVENILETVSIPVQLGGGIRSLEIMEAWLRAGIARLILGTLAVKDPDLVKKACKTFPGHIAVGLDARAGMVATEGWAESSNQSVKDMARRFEDVGIAAIIHTDIDRDGTLEGANIAASSDLAKATDIPIIVSGGVKDIKDITRVRKEGTLEGVISGKALYTGSLSLADALEAAGKKEKKHA